MTAHLFHIWIGVSLVGLWLMVMVIREGQARIFGLIRQRETLRQAVFEFREGLETEEEKVAELALCVENLQREFKELEEEGKKLTEAIKDVHQRLNRTPQTRYKERA